MKTIIIVLLVAASSLISKGASSQNYRVDSNGSIVRSSTTSTSKSPDRVHSTVDGVTFYIGSRGGVYYWKVSKNTGKKYKVYVKSGK